MRRVNKSIRNRTSGLALPSAVLDPTDQFWSVEFLIKSSWIFILFNCCFCFRHRPALLVMFGSPTITSAVNRLVLASSPVNLSVNSLNIRHAGPVSFCQNQSISSKIETNFYFYCFCVANWGYHRQGSCQAGLGATITPVRRLKSLFSFLFLKLKYLRKTKK